MSVRAPIALFALLVAVVAAAASHGDPNGLMLLTPVLAVMLPLLLGSYPGVRTVRKLASWFSRAVLGDTGRAGLLVLHCCDLFVEGAGFPAANGSRGPPSFAIRP
jgi:hypothetical protein